MPTMQVSRGHQTSLIANKPELKLFSANSKAWTANKTNKLLIVWNIIGFYGRFPVAVFADTSIMLDTRSSPFDWDVIFGEVLGKC